MNKISSYVKQNMASFSFYLRTVWQAKRSIFALTASDSVLGAAVSFLWIYFFKYLLDFMAEGEYGRAVLWVVACICSSEIVERIRDYLNLHRENAFFDVNTGLEARLAELRIEIPYEKVERADTIQQFEASYKCLGRNYLAAYTDSLVNVASALLVVSGVGAISAALGWWVAAVLFLVVIANAACYVVQSRYEIEEFNEENVVGRLLEHTRYWLTEKSRAKEVRAYVLHGFVARKMEEYNGKFFRMLRSFDRKQKKAYVGVCLLNGVQMAAVYSYCAWLFSQGGSRRGTSCCMSRRCSPSARRSRACWRP